MANVNLGDRFESFIAEQIREGRYQNASEVVRLEWWSDLARAYTMHLFCIAGNDRSVALPFRPDR